MARRIRELSPEEALDPRQKATAEEILAAAEDAPPAQRARLQSRLVERHAELLEVEATDVPGVVVLRQRTRDRASTHAVVAALDAEARRWVQARVAPPPDDPMAPVRKAVDDWDIEGVRTLLGQHADGRHPDALELLVWHLVDRVCEDGPVLAIELPATASPTVRGRVALAAARSRQVGRALRLLADVGPSPAAAARLELARAALDAGQVAGAGNFLAMAKAGDPTLPDLDEVAARVRAARAAQVGPLEQELAGLTGEAAVEVAQRILDLDPDHAGARATKRAAAEDSHARRIAALLEAARAAETLGDLGRARDRLREAEAEGAEVALDVERIAARIADQRRRAEVEAVRRAFERSVRDGCTSWLALDPELRASVGLDRPELPWLPDTVLLGARAGGAADAAIAAVATAAALERGDAGGAAARIADLRTSVGVLKGGRALVQRVDATARAQREADAAAALAQAEALLDADPRGAWARASRIDVTALDAAGRARVERLRTASRALAEERDLRAEAESEELFTARDASEALATRLQGDEAHSYADRVRERQATIQAEFRVRVWDEPDVDLRDFLLPTWERSAPYVTTDGRLVIVTARVHQVFVRIVDLDTRRVRRLIHLVTPELLDHPTWTVEGETVWASGRQSPLLHLDLDGTVLGWWDLQGFLPEGSQFHCASVVPGTHFCWVTGTRKEGVFHQVVDLRREGGIVRSRELLFDLVPLWGDPHRRVAGVRHGRGVAVFEAGGAPVKGWDGDRVPQARNLVRHPLRDDALVMLGAMVAKSRGHYPGLGWLDLVPDERPVMRQIPDTVTNRGTGSITALAQGMTFLSLVGAEYGIQVVGLGAGSDGLEELWHRSLHSGALLLGDEGSRRAWVAYIDIARGVVWEPLGREAPALHGAPERPDLWIPWLTAHRCPGASRYTTAEREVVGKVIGVLQERPEAERRVKALEIVESGAPDDARMVVYALEALRAKELGDEVVAAACAKWPDDVRLAFVAAHRDAVAERWDRVVQRLRRLERAEIPDAIAEHVCHLRGLAAWHRGDLEGAASAWAAGTDAWCPNGPLAELALARLGRPATRTGVGKLLHALAEADRCLAAGDPRGAIEALDAPQIWMAIERQTSARRATAWLAIHPEPGSADELRRALALSAFREVMSLPGSLETNDLPIPDAWDHAKLATLDEEAADALREVRRYPVVLRHRKDRDDEDDEDDEDD